MRWIMRAIVRHRVPPSQTAWALLGLMAAGLVDDEAVALGHALSCADPGGGWVLEGRAFHRDGFSPGLFSALSRLREIFPALGDGAFPQFENTATGPRFWWECDRLSRLLPSPASRRKRGLSQGRASKRSRAAVTPKVLGAPWKRLSRRRHRPSSVLGSPAGWHRDLRAGAKLIARTIIARRRRPLLRRSGLVAASVRRARRCGDRRHRRRRCAVGLIMKKSTLFT